MSATLAAAVPNTGASGLGPVWSTVASSASNTGGSTSGSVASIVASGPIGLLEFFESISSVELGSIFAGSLAFKLALFEERRCGLMPKLLSLSTALYLLSKEARILSSLSRMSSSSGASCGALAEAAKRSLCDMGILLGRCFFFNSGGAWVTGTSRCASVFGTDTVRGLASSSMREGMKELVLLGWCSISMSA